MSIKFSHPTTCGLFVTYSSQVCQSISKADMAEQQLVCQQWVTPVNLRKQ